MYWDNHTQTYRTPNRILNPRTGRWTQPDPFWNIHTVALLSDGTVWAWGGNGAGQLGDNTRTNRHTPIQVHNLTNATSVAAGRAHTVALRADGTAWAWGDNGNGALGSGTMMMSSIPVQVLNFNASEPFRGELPIDYMLDSEWFYYVLQSLGESELLAGDLIDVAVWAYQNIDQIISAAYSMSRGDDTTSERLDRLIYRLAEILGYDMTVSIDALMPLNEPYLPEYQLSDDNETPEY